MNIQNKPPHDPPRRIQVAPKDNVAIVVNGLGLPAGTAFPDGLVLNQFVPQGHKVALADIADGGNIIRYGEVIGTAKGAIKRGDWINEDNVVMGKALRPYRESRAWLLRRSSGAGGCYAVPADAGCGQWPQEGLGRPLGPAQRFDLV